MQVLKKAAAVIGIVVLFLLFERGAYAIDSTPSVTVTAADGVYYAEHSGERCESASLRSLINMICESYGSAEIYFDAVSASEDIYISGGSYTLSGALSLSSSLVLSDGARVSLNETRLSLLGGSVRVKDGVLSVSESRISSSGAPSLILDYNSSASLEILSGEILSSGADYAVLVMLGSATVAGGSVRCDGVCGIYNSATLALGGSAVVEGGEYSVITERPVSLSCGGQPLSAPLSVKYLADFAKGSATAVFYRASQEQAVELYNRSGETVPLKYFPSAAFTDEVSFIAAYLPFEVAVRAGGAVISKSEYLYGECAEAPTAPEREGYNFLGWYLDGYEYSFSEPVTSDLVIDARYRLCAPEFSISSLSFTYDGAGHQLGLSQLSHPLAERGFFTYEWYRNGVLLDVSSPTIDITTVSQSGEYFCKLKFTFSTDFVEVATPTVTVIVEKMKLALPTAEPKYYSGELQYSGIVSNALYTVNDSGGTLAGRYPVTLELTDAQNCAFEGFSGRVATVYFEIMRAENYWTFLPSIADIFEGASPSPVASSRFGEVKFLYSSEMDGEYSEARPTAVGEHYMIAAVEESENYTALISSPISFKVKAEAVTGIRLYTTPKKTEYTAFEQFDADGLSVIVSYNSGRGALADASVLSVSYQRGEALLYGDTAVTVEYMGVCTSVPVKVSRASYDISGIIFGGAEFIYDALPHSPIFSGVLPTGLDGIPLTAAVSREYTDAGEYTVYLVFSTESENYALPSALSARLKILPRPVTVGWSELDFVYDGSAKLPVAWVTLIGGERVPLSVSSARVGAGEYTAVAIAPNANYALENPNAVFKIAKADYDMSGVSWVVDSFVYDGELKSVFISGLPSGVSVVGYANASFTDAGEYTADASLSYDSDNYNPPAVPKCPWSISRAEYDMSGIEFLPSEFVYDGREHFPVFSGCLPLGADGSSPRYTSSEGATNVDDGEVTVILSFISDSKNYNAPADITATVRIIPKEIEVVWENLIFTYDKTEKLPSAVSDECEIRVTGSAANAGEYTATAAPVSNNYRIINSSARFLINKAASKFKIPLSVENVYESAFVSPYAEAEVGEVVYHYYSDVGMSEEIEKPTKPGVYFVAARIAESENYFSTRSLLLEFRILEVLPIGIYCEGVLECMALSEIDISRLAVYMKYNDASASRLSASLLSLTYQSGNTVKYGDTSVTVSCDGFSALCELSVFRRDYDMSSVVWSVSDFIYDGKEKRVTLSGLPDGVTVIGYENNGKVGAGSYTVKAILGYDTQNFNAPQTPSATLTINKQTVPLPDKLTFVYNGAPQSLTVVSAFYRAEPIYKTEAGVYTLPLELVDRENYAWETGADIAFLVFEIKPRVLTVEVESVEQYLFESLSEADFRIIGGDIAAGDEVNISLREENGVLVAFTDNRNYSIETVGGEIIRKESLSPSAISLIMLLILFLVMLTLCAVVLSSERTKARIAFMKKRRAPIVLATKDSVDEPSPKPCEIPEPVSEPEREGAEIALEMDVERADSLISDTLAKELLHREQTAVETNGWRRAIINVDTLSDNFADGERVDLNLLKDKNLIPSDSGRLKVLARGAINKALRVYANDFSISAVKMIVLTGGEAIKCKSTRRYRTKKKKKD